MLKKIALITAGLLITSCATTEFRQEKSICETTWTKKIPPRYERQTYNRSMSRQVPTGQTNCITSGYGNYAYTNCNQIMRTEYYTVPTVHTVDTNESRRDAKIAACTEKKCNQKYGNTKCETQQISWLMGVAKCTNIRVPLMAKHS